MMNTESITYDKPEETNIKLLEKIQTARRIFLTSGVKKSGMNKFHKYRYYELDDIVPVSLKIFEELGLANMFQFSPSNAVMYVYDLDTQEYISFSSPTPPVENGDVTKDMQDIGKIQTYSRRYLYMQLYDIVEADTIDLGAFGKKEDAPIDDDGGRPAREVAKLVTDQIRARGDRLSYENIVGVADMFLKNSTITRGEYEKMMVAYADHQREYEQQKGAGL